MFSNILFVFSNMLKISEIQSVRCAFGIILITNIAIISSSLNNVKMKFLQILFLKWLLSHKMTTTIAFCFFQRRRWSGLESDGTPKIIREVRVVLILFVFEFDLLVSFRLLLNNCFLVFVIYIFVVIL